MKKSATPEGGAPSRMIDARIKELDDCGEAYKSAVKLTFAKGASLKDPAGLFNSSLDGKVRRAIDLHEGDGLDEERSRRSYAPPRR